MKEFAIGKKFSPKRAWALLLMLAALPLAVPSAQAAIGHCLGDAFGASNCPALNLPPDCGDGGDGGDDGSGDDSQQPAVAAYAEGCPTCSGMPGSAGGSHGMPTWYVSEADMTLRLEDQPLGYQPAVGRRVSFHISFQSAGALPADSDVFGLGTNWSCNVKQFVYAPDGTGGNAYLHRGGAGLLTYTFGLPQVYDGSLISASGSGYVIEKMDGTVYTYDTPCTNGVGTDLLFLTSVTDPAGNRTAYVYATNSGVFQLTNIIDSVGNITHFYYANTTFPNLITSVVDPFGRSNVLSYSSIGLLTNSVDVAGLSSSFAYDAANQSNLTNLSTPYGNTGFSTGTVDDAGDPYFQVVVPTGGTYLYVYQTYCSFITGTPTAPTTTPFANTFEGSDGYSQFPANNSFFWSPLQYSELSTHDPTALTAADFNKGRMRHWLSPNTDSGLYAVSLDQAPSPDGTTPGQITWYDYEGKTYSEYPGNSAAPSFTAEILPDGTTHFSCDLRGPHLNVLTNLSTYSGPAGTVAIRTNTYLYAANNIDLLMWVGPNGEQVISNYFAPGNTFHEPNASFDALNQETAYVYNGYGQPVLITDPAGLTISNTYYASGPSFGRLASAIALPILATNSYTYYNNGLVETHTDPRGLTTTKSWDNLQRLTGITYPDGTTTSNLWTYLDITGQKDRLGNWTLYSYNGIRQRTAMTNANNVVTAYSYCDCGLLYSTTNAWNTPAQLVTSFAYDYQGHPVLITLPDAATTNSYDALGRKIYTCDAWGCLGYEYNNQSLVTNVFDDYGSEQGTIYNDEDLPISVTDANEVTVTNGYDVLHRLLSRTYPDGGVESYGYTARGVAVYTNQLNYTNFYVYDAAHRKTSETNADGQTLLYTNSPAGDLLSLTDGKGQTTRWKYDSYGRVTNKLDQGGTIVLKYSYDPDSRLTNRWSAAKGNTGYRYDNVGNLTYIAYPTITPVTFAYDSLNRLTNMVDEVGTTAYAYSSGGELYTETGPFASDTVTNVYVNRLRVGLGLQQPTGLWTNAFGYDEAKRLTGVVSPAGTFNYTYDPARLGEVEDVWLPNGSVITNRYDGNARLLGTWLKTSGGTILDAATYGYNVANERVTFTNAVPGTNVNYRYDPIGQLKTATSSASSENRGYVYDAAWNVTAHTNNGTINDFDVNSRNELTDVVFTAGGALALQALFGYDANGNLTSFVAASSPGSGTNYLYDDENRLAAVEATNITTGIITLTTFAYDGLSRLREQSWGYMSIPTGGGGGSTDALHGGATLEVAGDWTPAGGIEYIYDGYRVIQERDTNNIPTVSYTRGLDLSDTLQGAGGIGGLLARSGNYVSGSFTNHNYYHADGIGNITYLETTNQGLAASYRYDPFGNLLASSGAFATTNSYRFSSKEYMATAGFYYYGFRFYSPAWQRWLNRDPLEEAGGLNLYEFANNCPQDWVDSEGQFAIALPVLIFVPVEAGATVVAGGVVAAGYGAAWAGWQVGTAINDATGISDTAGDALGTVWGTLTSIGSGGAGRGNSGERRIHRKSPNPTKTNPKCSDPQTGQKLPEKPPTTPTTKPKPPTPPPTPPAEPPPAPRPTTPNSGPRGGPGDPYNGPPKDGGPARPSQY